VRACCRHVHSENERVLATVATLETAAQRAATDSALQAAAKGASAQDAAASGVAAPGAANVATVGRLLNQAHASARDDYDISCPELEALVEAARAVEGTLGARLTGAGWGGCIVALVHQDAVPEFKTQVSHRYRQATGRTPHIFACSAGSRAFEIPKPNFQTPNSKLQISNL
jgi:galactokinase